MGKEILLELIEINKSFRNKKDLEVVLESLSLKIYKNEILSIFGPNGCGKTTLLKIITRIIKPDRGYIKFYHLPKKTIFVHQDVNKMLLNWRNIKQHFRMISNIFKINFDNKAIKEILELVRLPITILEKYPYQLSGGERQRVIMAFVLYSKPDFLILDEPFNNIDLKTRLFFQDLIQKLFIEKKNTIILVSHNLDEIIRVSSRIIIMSNKPSKILLEIENKIKYPRGINLLSNTEILSIKNKIINLIGSNYV